MCRGGCLKRRVCRGGCLWRRVCIKEGVYSGIAVKLPLNNRYLIGYILFTERVLFPLFSSIIMH